eukprot:gnl/MRDRNA2_/MRDRNA2_18034_c0_seq1.p1 gnl/MRDRNA2_/MRDRNA2_18034_c0~~gnl/MRDRNA2_/MRDRNA2_18034_c0_seq1.p1  ORF type:complete len:660 (-),score=95.50 gnl/MRDRNA2_/MRDRNA2_18034_c0_seq1:8-1987(-)
MIPDEQRLKESACLLLSDVASQSYTYNQKVGSLAMWLGQAPPSVRAVLDGLCNIANSTNTENHQMILNCLAVLLDFRFGTPVSQNEILWKLARQKDWDKDKARLRALSLVLGKPNAGHGELLKLVLQVPQVEMPAALCIIVGATTTGSSNAQAEESIVLKLDQGQRHPFVERGVPEILGAVFRCQPSKTLDVLQQLLKRSSTWSKAAFNAARKMVVQRLIQRASLNSLRDQKREIQLECLGAVAGISQNANESTILERLCSESIFATTDASLAVLEVLFELPKVSSRSDAECFCAIARLIGNGKSKFASDTMRLNGYACLLGARPVERVAVLTKLAQSIQEGQLPSDLGGDVIRSILSKAPLLQSGKIEKHDVLKKIEEARDLPASLRKQLSDAVNLPPTIKNDTKSTAPVDAPKIPGTTGKAGSRAGAPQPRPKVKATQPIPSAKVSQAEVVDSEGSYEDYYSESEDGGQEQPGSAPPATAMKAPTMAEKLRALRAQKEALGSGTGARTSNGPSQDKEYPASRHGARLDATVGRSRGDRNSSNGPLHDNKEALARPVSRPDATVPRSKARPTRHRAPIYARTEVIDQSPEPQENESILKRRRRSPRSVSPYLMRPGLSPPRYAAEKNSPRSRSPYRMRPGYEDGEHRPARRRRRSDRF